MPRVIWHYLLLLTPTLMLEPVFGLVVPQLDPELKPVLTPTFVLVLTLVLNPVHGEALSL